MVRACSVHRCNSQIVKGGQVSFHLFPSDPEIRKLWITAVKEAREMKWNFIPGKFSYVCSKHFTKDSINTFGVAGSLKIRTLKPDAFPSIFFPSPTNILKKQLEFSEPLTSSFMDQKKADTSTVILQRKETPFSIESFSQEIEERQQSHLESVSDSSTIKVLQLHLL